MNRTPGASVSGVTKVPSMRRLSTAISTLRSRVGMRFDDCVFEERPRPSVVTLKIDGGMRRRFRARAVNLEAGGAHDRQLRIAPEGRERLRFGWARAADAPRLLQHARAPASRGVQPLRDVVVSARGERARK